MTVYVIRDGRLVVKHTPKKPMPIDTSMFPTPMLSRFTAMESPVTGKEITSWSDRDRDMAAAGAVDPSDLPRKPFEKRQEDASRQSDAPFEWRG